MLYLKSAALKDYIIPETLHGITQQFQVSTLKISSVFYNVQSFMWERN